jgi:hypothetical protein
LADLAHSADSADSADLADYKFPSYPISAQIGLFGSVKSAKIMLYLEWSNCRNGEILHLKNSNKSQPGLLKA